MLFTLGFWPFDLILGFNNSSISKLFLALSAFGYNFMLILGFFLVS
jgi:hypothetical protein